MNSSPSKEELKFKALAETAQAAVSGASIEEVADRGLKIAVEYIDLAAGALILWDEFGKVSVRSISAEREEDQKILTNTEDSLLTMLRQEFKLKAAYMEVEDTEIRSVFSLPLEIAGRQFGSLIGIKPGQARLFTHDEFLRSLAAVLALASSLDVDKKSGDAAALDEKIRSAREDGIEELATSINHYINNSLTSLSGNLQLIERENIDLPENIKNRLKRIEESAREIDEVTKRAQNANKFPSVIYLEKKKMIDLFADDAKDGKDKDGNDSKV